MLIQDKSGNIIGDSETWMDLSERDLGETSFQGAYLAGGNLSDSNLMRADFSGAHLYGTYLYRANLSGSSFRGATCQGAVFDEVDLNGADLTDARLVQDNMGTPCSMRGVDLRFTLLKNVVLSGCIYDSDTRFPVGFDPADQGMLLVQ